jgi:dihydroxy-acid dehydratase
MTDLRSSAWLGEDGKNGFIARHHLRAMGVSGEELVDRPVIGIANSWSELTPCNAHLRGLAEAVKRGVAAAGGLALEFPVLSLGEPFMRPSSMMYRNLMAMEVEALIRANPLDGVVLLTGCDKTTPGALMGWLSADVPGLMLTGGPMLNGRFRGRAVGSGTDIWRMTDGLAAGTVTREEFTEFESCLNRSAGHCMTMGTASTMAVLVEAMGLQLSGAAALPAVDSRRAVLAYRTGVAAVEIARSGVRPREIVTRAALENAIRVNAAIGGSTNAVVHLLAIAGRAGVPLELDDFDTLARDVPLLADVMPSGRFLMEEFAAAGGLSAVLAELGTRLDLRARVLPSGTLGDVAATARNDDRSVVRPLDDPLLPAGAGTVVLRGNLAPDGALLKVSAASPSLLRHTGTALVFDSIEDYRSAAGDPDLPVDRDTVLVVRGGGPVGYPGMPEIGNFPVPGVLLRQGVTDLVRISDARMSGTAFGTCILHVSPEAAVGGPLGLVRSGDVVTLDVEHRELRLEVDDAELARRRTDAPALAARAAGRGWEYLYATHVQQAHLGADLDFLVGWSDSAPGREAF